MKVIVLFVFSCSLAWAYDFELRLTGPATATAGYPIFLQINLNVTEGVRDGWTTYDLSSPFETSLVGPNTHPQWGNKTFSPGNVMLRVDIPPDAEPGLHRMSVTARSDGGVTHQDEMDLYVVVPAASQNVVVQEGRPAALKVWERNMIFSGEARCDEEAIQKASTWDGNVWYYDGIRVFYQIADYLGEPKWTDCAKYVKSVYLPYVLGADGAVPGYKVFPQGLYQDYLRTGDDNSRKAVLLLAKNSAYARSGGHMMPSRSRETAYLLEADQFARFLGEPNPNEERTLAFALGHLDQWFNLRSRYTGEAYFLQPFMVGLTMEALIGYYEESPDPRIPPAIQMALDGMWEYWVDQDQGFDYITNDSEVKGAPDLNLLIAPAYAWMYLQTGDPIYRERGEKLFIGGVQHAWLGQGKQFSQNYRWSFDYVRWATITDGTRRPRIESLRRVNPPPKRGLPRPRE